MDTIGPSRLPTMPRCLFSSIWVSRDRDDLHVLSFRGLYALYASKSSLCTLCKHITPELTAYNAYKKTAWLRSRAEGTKMYAVGDAYKVHTECIQAYKKRKREEFFFTSSYTACLFIFYCPCLQAIKLFSVRVFRHVRIPSNHPNHPSGLIACSSRSRSVAIHDKPLGS